jgi:nucleoside-triphosphatase
LVSKIFISGDPGIGKTTVIAKVVYELKSRGYRIGGVLTRDIRERGARIGFQIISLNDGTTGILASSKLKNGPHVGKYVVNLNDLKNIFASSLVLSVDNADVIVCDEVGPMELFSPEARRAIELVLQSGKPLVGSMHKRLQDPLIDKIKEFAGVKLLEVTLDNRNLLPSTIVEEIIGYFK